MGACTQSTDWLTQATDEAQIKQSAQNWFDQNAQNQSKNRRNALANVSRKPDWHLAKQYLHRGQPLLELPLAYEGKNLIGVLENDPQSRGLTKLLLRQNADRSFTPIIMRIYASGEYLKNPNNRLSNNSFGLKDPKFSGEVYFYDWNEEFLGVNHYKNGKIVKSGRASQGKVSCITTCQIQYSPNGGGGGADDGQEFSGGDAYITVCNQTCYPSGVEPIYNYDPYCPYNNCGGSSGGGSDNGGGDNGEGDSNNPPVSSGVDENTILIKGISENGVIQDIRAYTKCFTHDANSIYKITINIDQPIAGSRAVIADSDGNTGSAMIKERATVGHTFLTFEQIKKDGTRIIRSMGFYPIGSVGVSPKNPSSPGGLVNDEEHKFDASLSLNMPTSTDFYRVLNTFSSYHIYNYKEYDLYTDNCTSACLTALNENGIKLPVTPGSFILGLGSNPGNLGEDIKSLREIKGYNYNTPNYSYIFSVNPSGGVAPKNRGFCN